MFLLLADLAYMIFSLLKFKGINCIWYVYVIDRIRAFFVEKYFPERISRKSVVNMM